MPLLRGGDNGHGQEVPLLRRMARRSNCSAPSSPRASTDTCASADTCVSADAGSNSRTSAYFCAPTDVCATDSPSGSPCAGSCAGSGTRSAHASGPARAGGGR